MLVLQVVECLVLIQVLLYDLPRMEVSAGGGIVELYFWACSVTVLLQVAGILLVLREHYRTGGVLQIASCVLHLPKGEGILGLMGGINAFRYGRSSMESGVISEKAGLLTVKQG